MEQPAAAGATHRVLTKPIPDLRREYYFDLHRLCHLDDQRIDALGLVNFANLIDRIDLRNKQEVQLAGLGLPM